MTIFNDPNSYTVKDYYAWQSSDTCYKPVNKPPCYKSKCPTCAYKETCANYSEDPTIPYKVTYNCDGFTNTNRPANESGFI